MQVKFTVRDLPPKKDGANSMWRNGVDLPRLRALRTAAAAATAGSGPFRKEVHLTIVLHADSPSGDLYNFGAGICDGLQAAHAALGIDEAWGDLSAEVRPANPVAIEDDAIVCEITVRRLPSEGNESWYEVTILGE